MIVYKEDSYRSSSGYRLQMAVVYVFFHGPVLRLRDHAGLRHEP